MSLGSVLRVAAVLFFATAAAMLPLTAITQDRAFLWEGVVVIGLLTYIAAGLRLARLRPVVVHLVQIGVLVAISVGSALQIRNADGDTIGVGQVVALGIDQMRTQAAPIASSAPSRWLILVFIGLILIVTDLLVTTLAAPAWALAPLATMYLIPALAAPDDLPWWHFALLAAGYLALLATDAVNSNDAWTRNVDTDTANRASAQWGVWRMAAVVGVPALALAIAAGSFIPLLGNTPPIGNGHSGAAIQMQDPTIDLSKDLNQPDNRKLLTYTTTSPTGLYLRVAALTVVGSSGWRFPQAGVALNDGELPSPPGASNDLVPTSGTVQIGDFDSEYLPLPYAPTSFTATGDWRFNPATMMVLSTAKTGRRQATRGLDYSFSASVVQPDPVQFARAIAGTPASDTQTVSQVPNDVPQVIINLAHEITRGAGSDAVKAAQIQAYLSNPSVFSYDTQAPPGSGYDVLVNFLTRTHSGYCIHYASAMALMARIVGIPSRVAVGFLPGHKVGDGWEVDVQDSHAWPELYFQGYGWVRFEPTTAISAAPAWTQVTNRTAPQPSASASASSTISVGASSGPSRRPSASAKSSAPVAPGPTTPSGPGTNWGAIVGRGLAGLGVVLLLCVPMLVRMLQRRRRLGAHADPHEAIGQAWAEVRASLLDRGSRWPNGSPRAVSERLAHTLDSDAIAAVQRIGHWVELSRYAPELSESPAGLDADVTAVRRSWRTRMSWQQRLWATLAPRSLWVALRDRVQRMIAGAPTDVKA